MLMPSGYITAYVTLLTVSTLIFFYSNSIKIKLDFIDYFVCIFFVSSLISTLVNIKILGFFLFFKSILDLRFIVFFLIIRNLIKSKFIDPKIFAFFALISTSFLSIDIIYQHINGQDFFGNKPFDGRFNGIFEHEAVAGVVISLIIIELSNLNQVISPFFFAGILFYIFFEVFFSFFRKIFSNLSPLKPDTKHLHMLIFKYVFYKVKNFEKANYLTGFLINIFYFFLIIPLLLNYKNMTFCKLYFLILINIYLFFYFFLKGKIIKLKI